MSEDMPPLMSIHTGTPFCLRRLHAAWTSFCESHWLRQAHGASSGDAGQAGSEGRNKASTPALVVQRQFYVTPSHHSYYTRNTCPGKAERVTHYDNMTCLPLAAHTAKRESVVCDAGSLLPWCGCGTSLLVLLGSSDAGSGGCGAGLAAAEVDELPSCVTAVLPCAHPMAGEANNMRFLPDRPTRARGSLGAWPAAAAAR
jgi:hypothetical protein